MPGLKKQQYTAKKQGRLFYSLPCFFLSSLIKQPPLEPGCLASPVGEFTLNANFPGFYNSSHTADRFSASRISFMHDFPEMRGSQL